MNRAAGSHFTGNLFHPASGIGALKTNFIITTASAGKNIAVRPTPARLLSAPPVAPTIMERSMLLERT